MDNNEKIVTEWSGLQLIPEGQFSIADAAKGSGNTYTGSLTISPLIDQYNGTYTCTVTVMGGTVATASGDITLSVIGECVLCGDNCHITPSTALPPPVVTISPASGVPTAGKTYFLTCSVETVPRLVVEPNIEWSKLDGSVVSMSSGYNLPLNFDPLMTLHGDLYTCRASVDITDINVSLSVERPIELIVLCKLPKLYNKVIQLKTAYFVQYHSLTW